MTLREQLEQMISARWKGVHPETREEVFGYALATLDAVEAHVQAMREQPQTPTLGQIQQHIADLRATLTLSTTPGGPGAAPMEKWNPACPVCHGSGWQPHKVGDEWLKWRRIDHDL